MSNTATPLETLQLAFVPMQTAHLNTVLEVEKCAYSHPWNQRHFQDSMDFGHLCTLLAAEATDPDLAPDSPRLPDQRQLLGHMVAMRVLDETHLLNLTVAPAHQRRGWGRLMLQALALRARADGAQWLWLEVRESNLAAQALYRSTGFHVVGQRRGYYPDGPHRRENAVVMSLNLMAQPPVAAPHCPAWT